MDINIGPLALRAYSGDNWSHLELAFITNRNGGKARRETALRGGFKSEHLVDMVGKDLASDTFECPDTGTLYFGKIIQTPSGTYVISAKEVYTRAIYEKACKEGLKQAEAATSSLQPQPVA